MLTELEDGLREIAEREVREVWEGVGREEVRAEEAREEEAEVRGRARRKVEELYRIFAVADPANMQRRVRIGFVLFCFVSLARRRRRWPGICVSGYEQFFRGVGRGDRVRIGC